MLADVVESIGGPSLTALRALQRIALDRNERVYLVGGPVRDALLGRPLKDLDFAVEGNAAALAASLAGEIEGRLVVHRRFRTASVIATGCTVDLVTARREHYPQPGALPDVIPASIEDDLARRDFSINAMAIPLAPEGCALIDHCSGREDLRRGLVRILHPNSFTDDPTRIFRAVRYEQRLGFEIEAATLESIQRTLRDKRIDLLTGDRVRHELERILKEENPAPALVRAMELGVLAGMHPALTGEGFLNRIQRLAEGSRNRALRLDPLVWLAALVHHLDEPQGHALAQRLNMPRSWRSAVESSVCLREHWQKLGTPGLADSSLVHILGHCSEDAVLAASLFGKPVHIRERLSRYLEHLRRVKPDVDGDDLRELGIAPGPELGQILEAVREAKLDGLVVTKAEQVQLARDILVGRRQKTPALEGS